MTSLSTALRNRRIRSSIQVAALVGLAGSVALVSTGSTGGRVLGGVVQAVIIGVTLKLSLVAAHTGDRDGAELREQATQLERATRRLSEQIDRESAGVERRLKDFERLSGESQGRIDEIVDVRLEAITAGLSSLGDEIAQRSGALDHRVHELESTLRPDEEELAILRRELVPALAMLTALQSELLAVTEQLDRIDRRLARDRSD